ncbi:unnamed protein product [Darwinula stevensoni]|uniref:Aminodeoxychorismate lyase n=1 Tax=Darwinula stevensoni TaxID=69355 RepID=A0A7R9AJJ3_9CRUS|nr:unnamed protein product [Darwinula stevensoni]CAG0907822.1 unnamed protein product [Darwinula stevensoni]
MSEQELLAAINIPALPTLEGYLAPDTYLYPRDTSDLVFFRQAAKKMQTDIRTAWEQRAEDLAISSPAEMVNLASIIEKETAHPSDRNSVAAVFHNRLKIDMPLQTDPTVIYGMGETYRGNIRKVDLQTDTPWNTYTRRGLPATPIAMPGRAALLAAVQPAPTDALYFVSLNDGSGKSHFSNNLNAHNQAVQRYILKRP